LPQLAQLAAAEEVAALRAPGAPNKRRRLATMAGHVTAETINNAPGGGTTFFSFFSARAQGEINKSRSSRIASRPKLMDELRSERLGENIFLNITMEKL